MNQPINGMKLPDDPADRKLTILLIEDNASDIRLVQEMLKEAAGESCRFIHKDRLSAGLVFLAENPVDAILVDLGLPDSQGIDTFLLLQKAYPYVPVIVLTGLQDNELAIHAVRMGAQDYLVKEQVSGDLLFRSIHYAINRKQVEAALKETLENYRVLADSVDSMYMVDGNCTYLFVNEGHRMTLGLPLEEIIGKRHEEFHSGEHEREFAETIREVCETGKPITQEHRGEKRDKYFLRTFFPRMGQGREGKISQVIVVAKDITDRKQAEEALQGREKEARQLAQENELIAEIGRIIGSTLNIEEVYERFAWKVKGIIKFNRIAVNTINVKDYTRTVRHLKGERDVGILIGEIRPLAGTGVEQALLLKSSLIIDSNKEEELRKKFPGLSSFPTGAKSTMIIPLISKDEVIGTLSFHSDRINAYSENDVRLAEKVASQIAGAIANAQLFLERKQAEEKLQETLESLRNAVNTTIQVMVSAVETRDPYTAGHQVRSANLARAIATEMGLPQEKVDGIRMAGSIHDIGKLSIPAEILSKPKKLSEIEYSLIKEHARRGFNMLKDVESPWPLAEIVYQHHERIDGSGYPRNLKGEEILLEARVLNVADVVEAMSSHRPYRPGLGIDAALNEIEKNSGTYYDTTVADACLRLFREKGFQLEGNSYSM